MSDFKPHVCVTRGQYPQLGQPSTKIYLSIERYFVNADPRTEEAELDLAAARKLFTTGLKLCDDIEAEHSKRLTRSLAKALNVEQEAVQKALSQTGLQLLDPLVQKPGIPQL